jgi:AhpD family alkylhydroperoxidase
MNPAGALDGKTKQLIGLGVAAQIPCAYCVYAHTKAAKAAGATDAQIKEAIATAALVRFNSTMARTAVSSGIRIEYGLIAAGDRRRCYRVDTLYFPLSERRLQCPLWVRSGHCLRFA